MGPARPAAGVSSPAVYIRPASVVARPVPAGASASAVTKAAVAAAAKPAVAAAAAARSTATAAATAAAASVRPISGVRTAPAVARSVSTVAVITGSISASGTAMGTATTVPPTFPAHVFTSTPAHHRPTFRPRSHQKLPMDIDAHAYPSAQFGPISKGPLAGFQRSPLQEITNAPTEPCYVPPKSVGHADFQEEWEEMENDPWAGEAADEELNGDEDGGGTGQDIEREGRRWEMDSDEEAPVQVPGRRRVTGPRPRDYFDDEDMGDAGDAYQPQLQEPESEHEPEAGPGSGEDEQEEIELDPPIKSRHTRRSRKAMEDEGDVDGDDGDGSGKGSANRCLRGISAERRAPVRLAYIRLRCYTATRNPFPTPEQENEMIDKAWKWVRRNREEYAGLQLLSTERPVVRQCFLLVNQR